MGFLTLSREIKYLSTYFCSWIYFYYCTILMIFVYFLHLVCPPSTRFSKQHSCTISMPSRTGVCGKFTPTSLWLWIQIGVWNLFTHYDIDLYLVVGYFYFYNRYQYHNTSTKTTAVQYSIEWYLFLLKNYVLYMKANTIDSSYLYDVLFSGKVLS